MEKHNPKFSYVSPLYLVCTVLFVTCLLLSNVAASKMFSLGPLVLTAGALLFPITYILNDVLAEVYGFKRARLTIFLGFAMNVLMVLYFLATIALPYPSFFQNQAAYATILGSTPRILGASLAAYLAGSTLNAKVMVLMKKSKGNESLLLRCVASTLFGESVDSIIFVTLAFLGTMPFNAMLVMIATQASVKTAYEFVIYPVTQRVIKKIKLVEGVR